MSPLLELVILHPGNVTHGLNKWLGSEQMNGRSAQESSFLPVFLSLPVPSGPGTFLAALHALVLSEAQSLGAHTRLFLSARLPGWFWPVLMPSAHIC